MGPQNTKYKLKYTYTFMIYKREGGNMNMVNTLLNIYEYVVFQ